MKKCSINQAIVQDIANERLDLSLNEVENLVQTYYSLKGEPIHGKDSILASFDYVGDSTSNFKGGFHKKVVNTFEKVFNGINFVTGSNQSLPYQTALGLTININDFEKIPVNSVKDHLNLTALGEMLDTLRDRYDLLKDYRTMTLGELYFVLSNIGQYGIHTIFDEVEQLGQTTTEFKDQSNLLYIPSINDEPYSVEYYVGSNRYHDINGFYTDYKPKFGNTLLKEKQTDKLLTYYPLKRHKVTLTEFSEERPQYEDLIEKTIQNSDMDTYSKAILLDLIQRSNVPHKVVTQEEVINMSPENYRGQPAFFYNGVIYFIDDKINKDTVLHEFLHPYVYVFKEFSKKAYNNAFDEIVKDGYWRERYMEHRENYSNDDLAKEEVVTEWLERLFSNEEAIVNNKLKSVSWLKQLWNGFISWLERMLNVSPGKFSKLTYQTSIGQLINFVKNENLSKYSFSYDDYVRYKSFDKETNELLSKDSLLKFLSQIQSKQISNNKASYTKPVLDFSEGLSKTKMLLDSFVNGKIANKDLQGLSDTMQSYFNNSDSVIFNDITNLLKNINAAKISNLDAIDLGENIKSIVNQEISSIFNYIGALELGTKGVEEFYNIVQKEIISKEDKKEIALPLLLNLFTNVSGLMKLVEDFNDFLNNAERQGMIENQSLNGELDETLANINTLSKTFKIHYTTLSSIRRNIYENTLLDVITDLMYKDIQEDNQIILDILRDSVSFFKKGDTYIQNTIGLSNTTELERLQELLKIKDREYTKDEHNDLITLQNKLYAHAIKEDKKGNDNLGLFRTLLNNTVLNLINTKSNQQVYTRDMVKAAIVGLLDVTEVSDLLINPLEIEDPVFKWFSSKIFAIHDAVASVAINESEKMKSLENEGKKLGVDMKTKANILTEIDTISYTNNSRVASSSSSVSIENETKDTKVVKLTSPWINYQGKKEKLYSELSALNAQILNFDKLIINTPEGEKEFELLLKKYSEKEKELEELNLYFYSDLNDDYQKERLIILEKHKNNKTFQKYFNLFNILTRDINDLNSRIELLNTEAIESEDRKHLIRELQRKLHLRKSLFNKTYNEKGELKSKEESQAASAIEEYYAKTSYGAFDLVYKDSFFETSMRQAVASISQQSPVSTLSSIKQLNDWIKARTKIDFVRTDDGVVKNIADKEKAGEIIIALLNKAVENSKSLTEHNLIKNDANRINEIVKEKLQLTLTLIYNEIENIQEEIDEALSQEIETISERIEDLNNELVYKQRELLEVIAQKGLLSEDEIKEYNESLATLRPYYKPKLDFFIELGEALIEDVKNKIDSSTTEEEIIFISEAVDRLTNNFYNESSTNTLEALQQTYREIAKIFMQNDITYELEPGFFGITKSIKLSLKKEDSAVAKFLSKSWGKRNRPKRQYLQTKYLSSEVKVYEMNFTDKKSISAKLMSSFFNQHSPGQGFFERVPKEKYVTPKILGITVDTNGKWLPKCLEISGEKSLTPNTKPITIDPYIDIMNQINMSLGKSTSLLPQSDNPFLSKHWLKLYEDSPKLWEHQIHLLEYFWNVQENMVNSTRPFTELPRYTTEGIDAALTYNKTLIAGALKSKLSMTPDDLQYITPKYLAQKTFGANFSNIALHGLHELDVDFVSREIYRSLAIFASNVEKQNLLKDIAAYAYAFDLYNDLGLTNSEDYQSLKNHLISSIQNKSINLNLDVSPQSFTPVTKAERVINTRKILYDYFFNKEFSGVNNRGVVKQKWIMNAEKIGRHTKIGVMFFAKPVILLKNMFAQILGTTERNISIKAANQKGIVNQLFTLFKEILISPFYIGQAFYKTAESEYHLWSGTPQQKDKMLNVIWSLNLIPELTTKLAFEKLGFKKEGALDIKLFAKRMFELTNRSGDYYSVLSTLNTYLIKLGDKHYRLFDLFDIKNDKLVSKSFVPKEWEISINDKGHYIFGNKLQDYINHIQNETALGSKKFNGHLRPVANTNWIVMAISSLKNFIAPGLYDAFRKQQIDTKSGTIKSGWARIGKASQVIKAKDFQTIVSDNDIATDMRRKTYYGTLMLSNRMAFSYLFGLLGYTMIKSYFTDDDDDDDLKDRVYKVYDLFASSSYVSESDKRAAMKLVNNKLYSRENIIKLAIAKKEGKEDEVKAIQKEIVQSVYSNLRSMQHNLIKENSTVPYYFLLADQSIEDKHTGKIPYWQKPFEASMYSKGLTLEVMEGVIGEEATFNPFYTLYGNMAGASWLNTGQNIMSPIALSFYLNLGKMMFNFSAQKRYQSTQGPLTFEQKRALQYKNTLYNLILGIHPEIDVAKKAQQLQTTR